MSTTAPTLPYRLEPSDLSTLSTAPIGITREIVVPAPREAVWATISDAEAMPAWFAGVTRAIYTSQPPIDVGATRFIEIGRLQANEEILVFDPPERFAFRVVEVNQWGLAAMVEDIAEQPHGADHTQLRYRQAIVLRPAVKIGWSLTALPSLGTSIDQLPDHDNGAGISKALAKRHPYGP